jgi:CubicO group peptidase (beta-lactamase class C family)
MTRRLVPLALTFVLTATVAGAACSGDDDATAPSTTVASPSAASTTRTTGTTPPRVPGADWEKVDPAAVGLDPAKLDEVARTAEEGKSNCLAVVRDGRLAGEWYFRGTNANSTQDIFSATKSISSTLVGIAQDDGDLRVGDRASKWIPQWRGTPADAVTVRDLLSNDSGREWSPAIDYVQLLRAADRSAFAVDLAQSQPPGKVWAYNNSAIQTLQRVLAGATGREVTTFAQQRLFDAIGMTHTTMTKDRAGNAQMFEGVRSTCRDLARFGLLMLDHGKWGDRQVVSSSWVDAATGRASTTLNAGYGYLWWLNRPGVHTDPLAAVSLEGAANPTSERGQIAPGAPADMYWALGLGNQVVQVDPGTKTVVVRLGTAEPRPQPPTFGAAAASKVVTDAVVDQ